jgi:hypothetical protein
VIFHTPFRRQEPRQEARRSFGGTEERLGQFWDGSMGWWEMTYSRQPTFQYISIFEWVLISAIGLFIITLLYFLEAS